ncbi:MAG: hypothetical protein M0Z65_10650 [Firmicutes bacterium]|uniref:Uncharacterized protein n=1 Tax=Melghirimyces thermohalophilus TaxID=1236220 RepID=A0A1G6QVH4_9BACL|nr:hypothetical protein [Melghirimyces thermohalophilus]MDA8353618.1 hypothetical protein [Bacillota bacterium]SDC96278.1 hypothetical protein SAMN04488112_12425 [Melghirimyces thermohalophilus]
MHRSDLVHQLEAMQPDHICLFPRLRNAPQITIQCFLRGGARHWKVEQGTNTAPVPYVSSDVQHVVDYLLQLRPLENFTSSLTLIREETTFETLL